MKTTVKRLFKFCAIASTITLTSNFVIAAEGDIVEQEVGTLSQVTDNYFSIIRNTDHCSLDNPSPNIRAMVVTSKNGQAIAGPCVTKENGKLKELDSIVKVNMNERDDYVCTLTRREGWKPSINKFQLQVRPKNSTFTYDQFDLSFREYLNGSDGETTLAASNEVDIGSFETSPIIELGELFGFPIAIYKVNLLLTAKNQIQLKGNKVVTGSEKLSDIESIDLTLLAVGWFGLKKEVIGQFKCEF